MFGRKGRLRREMNGSFTELLERMKNEWLKQKRIVEMSIEPSPEVIYQLKIAEAKYFFLLKEARYKNMTYKF
ncbi:YaaL family protein [Pullulanibacillus sp. KACC 23026]|uniref:YaaL family protein n=1 Tax=Pullulanibacillus sp. KACC 23026 TaxID=3028315 RepID=UPI0023AF758B|nr:YaaL family protein [Pullulanibacillus sp. KACC 23026]WEG12757.1 YaaL family protein [Pullulanibacillus sp. KACC 23026]